MKPDPRLAFTVEDAKDKTDAHFRAIAICDAYYGAVSGVKPRYEMLEVEARPNIIQTQTTSGEVVVETFTFDVDFIAYSARRTEDG